MGNSIGMRKVVLGFAALALVLGLAWILSALSRRTDQHEPRLLAPATDPRPEAAEVASSPVSADTGSGSTSPGTREAVAIDAPGPKGVGTSAAEWEVLVLDDRGQPVPDVELLVYAGTREALWTEVSGADGVVQHRGAHTARRRDRTHVSWKATAPDRPPLRGSLPGGNRAWTIVLPAHAWVPVRVLGPDGEVLLEDLEWRLLTGSRNFRAWEALPLVPEDSRPGVRRIPIDAARNVGIEIRGADMGPLGFDLQPVDDEFALASVQEFSLLPSRGIRVRFVDPAGAPLEGLELSLRHLRPYVNRPWTRLTTELYRGPTGPDGWVEVRAWVEMGFEVDVWVMDPRFTFNGRARGVGTLDKEGDDSEFEVVLDLDPPTHLEVRVSKPLRYPDSLQVGLFRRREGWRGTGIWGNEWVPLDEEGKAEFARLDHETSWGLRLQAATAIECEPIAILELEPFDQGERRVVEFGELPPLGLLTVEGRAEARLGTQVLEVRRIHGSSDSGEGPSVISKSRVAGDYRESFEIPYGQWEVALGPDGGPATSEVVQVSARPSELRLDSPLVTKVVVLCDSTGKPAPLEEVVMVEVDDRRLLTSLRSDRLGRLELLDPLPPNMRLGIELDGRIVAALEDHGDELRMPPIVEFQLQSRVGEEGHKSSFEFELSVEGGDLLDYGYPPVRIPSDPTGRASVRSLRTRLSLSPTAPHFQACLPIEVDASQVANGATVTVDIVPSRGFSWENSLSKAKAAGELTVTISESNRPVLRTRIDPRQPGLRIAPKAGFRFEFFGEDGVAVQGEVDPE